MIDLIFSTFTSIFSFSLTPLFLASLLFLSIILIFRSLFK